MTSQLNNSNENKDQVLQETETFPVFFENTTQRTAGSVSGDSANRACMDAPVIRSSDQVNQAEIRQDQNSSQPVDISSTLPDASSILSMNHKHTQLHHRHLILQQRLVDSSHKASDDISPHTPVPSAPEFSHTDSSSRFTSSKKDSYPLDRNIFRKAFLHRGFVGGNKKNRITTACTGNSSSFKAPKVCRRFRSRSLPIISHTSRSVMLQQLAHALRGRNEESLSTMKRNHTSSHKHNHSNYLLHLPQAPAPTLPPINLQSLKEIDLQEILKNPQLRHDILFDPQLQFRPNLDGDRGKRKKTIIDRYWVEIGSECLQFFKAAGSGSAPAKFVRLPALFTTLRDILLSLLPIKDRAPVNEIMDIELIVQQLNHGSFDFVAMAQWLGDVFKSHCAPMRDQWVSEMIEKFREAFAESSIVKLVLGLRSVFSILEAMKLDVANHQIRILRPVLIDTAVDFEKDYFIQLINHCKIDISDSLRWFMKKYDTTFNDASKPDLKEADYKSVIASSIIDLLSCRNMASEFPSTLAFDHTRLVLLRADVRQQVCVQLCIVLYKQLVSNYELAASYKQASLEPKNLAKVQEEILAIVTDDNGNVKWTRNIQSIALQLVKNVVSDPRAPSQPNMRMPQAMIDFSYNWLTKQIQPSSAIYGMMEDKIFKELLAEVSNSKLKAPQKTAELKFGVDATASNPESVMVGIANRISTLVKFHWSVFGDFYLEQVQKLAQA